jgi:cell division protein FtsL
MINFILLLLSIFIISCDINTFNEDNNNQVLLKPEKTIILYKPQENNYYKNIEKTGCEETNLPGCKPKNGGNGTKLPSK